MLIGITQPSRILPVGIQPVGGYGPLPKPTFVPGGQPPVPPAMTPEGGLFNPFESEPSPIGGYGPLRPVVGPGFGRRPVVTSPERPPFGLLPEPRPMFRFPMPRRGMLPMPVRRPIRMG